MGSCNCLYPRPGGCPACMGYTTVPSITIPTDGWYLNLPVAGTHAPPAKRRSRIAAIAHMILDAQQKD